MAQDGLLAKSAYEFVVCLSSEILASPTNILPFRVRISRIADNLSTLLEFFSSG